MSHVTCNGFRLPTYPKVRSRREHNGDAPGWYGNSILYPEMDKDLFVPSGEELKISEFGVTLVAGTQIRLQFWQDSYFLFAGQVVPS